MNEKTWQLISASRAIAKDADVLWRPAQEPVHVSKEHVLSHSIVRGTRGYIERTVHQINATYDASCFDACSVMIRKLVETLIIEAFEHHTADHLIKTPQGDFVRLSEMIDVTLRHSWNLGRETKRNLPRFKTVGDRSAHNRRYSAHRSDIDGLVDPLRLVAQELLSLADLK